MITSNSRALSTLLRELGFVDSIELGAICFECLARNALANGGEEFGEDVVVVDLNQCPAEHFLGGEEMLDEGSVVGSAGVAVACCRDGNE